MTAALLTVVSVYYLANAVMVAHLYVTFLRQSRPATGSFLVWCASWLVGLTWPAVLVGFLIVLLVRRK